MKKKTATTGLAVLAGTIITLGASAAGAGEPGGIPACPAPQSLDYAYLTKLKSDCRYDMGGLTQVIPASLCNNSTPIFKSDLEGSAQFCSLRGNQGSAVLLSEVFNDDNTLVGQNILIVTLGTSIKKLYLH